MRLREHKTDVIIDETIERIKVNAGFLRLYIEDGILGDIPVYQINSVLIMGSNIDIPARLIKLCAEYKIPIHILTNQNKHYGSLHFAADQNVINRQSQYMVSLDETWRTFLAQQILHQKILIQSRLMATWLGKDYHKAQSYHDISRSLSSIPKKKTPNSLLGVEGSAAVLYWEQFGKQVEEKGGFEWPGRIKNPCRDPVNSLLSLAYGLLATQCQSSLTLQGLDPYFGLLHKTNDDRPALTYDLMELYRCLLVDLWVLGLIRSETFTSKDFTSTKEGVCTLLSDKKNEFFKLWFKRLKYYKFQSNYGDLSIKDFLDANTKLLIDWFERINKQKFRKSKTFERLPGNLIVFESIGQFAIVHKNI